jgi:hypothetical protein
LVVVLPENISVLLALPIETPSAPSTAPPSVMAALPVAVIVLPLIVTVPPPARIAPPSAMSTWFPVSVTVLFLAYVTFAPHEGA